MKNFFNKLRWSTVLGGMLGVLLSAGVAYAINITVPSSPGNNAGYFLVSTSTGAYISTTTSPLYIGSIYASSTALTNYIAGKLGVGYGVPVNKLDVNGSVSLVSSGFLGFMGNATVDATNYSLFGNTTLTLLNARSGASIGFRINNVDVANFTTTGGFGFGNTFYNLDPGANNMIIEGNLGIATSTPVYPLNPYSATAPQLALSTGSGIAQWTLRNAGGNFYLSTTTVAGTATSSIALLSIDGATGTSTFTGGVGLTQTKYNALRFDIGLNPTYHSGVQFDENNTMSMALWYNGSGSADNNKLAIFDTANNVERVTFLRGGHTGIGTTTPSKRANLTLSTTTTPQLSLTGDPTNDHWTFRSIGDNFYIATASPTTLATSTVSNFSINANGFVTMPSLVSGLVRSTNGLLAGGATVISTDVDLADLTAGDTSLTFSGTYDGQTARTIVLNVGRTNTWSVLQNFNYSSSTIYSSFLTASSTFLNAGTLTFGGVTASTWPDFCATITGDAGLCDGNDATGAGGGDDPFTHATIHLPTSATTTKIGIGTTTPYYNLTVASSTGSQIALSQGANVAQWVFRNAGGNLYFATTSVVGTATSTFAAFSIDNTGTQNIYFSDAATSTLLNVNGSSFLVSSSTGKDNYGFGPGNLGKANTTGSDNTALGKITLAAHTSGTANTAFGNQALQKLTSGNSNMAIGYNSMNTQTSGSFNLAIGRNALFGGTTSSSTIAIGYVAMQNTGNGNTQGNIAIGLSTILNPTTNADYNTVIGTNAGTGITLGSGNVMLGYAAGNNVTTGKNNILIGWSPRTKAATNSDFLNIGGLIFGTLPATSTPATALVPSAIGAVGIATTTLQHAGRLNIASTTMPQIALIAGDTQDIWTLRSAGNFYLATSSPTAFATSTNPVITVDTNAQIYFPTVGAAAGTPNDACLEATTNQLVENAALTCTVSSRLFKNDEGYLAGNYMDTLMKMKPVQFAYKDHPERSRWGFYSEDMRDLDRKLGDGYMPDGRVTSIDQNAILAVTVKSLQELNKRVDSINGMGKSIQDQWQWIVIGFLVCWNLALTFRKK